VIDARTLNWRFLVPDEPEGLLLLPIGEERVPAAIVPERDRASLWAALDGRTYPAVVAADLSAWSTVAGTRPSELLDRLAASVATGGFLYAGFSNPWYPGTRRSDSLPWARARRIVEGRGMSGSLLYLAFPDHACPAYLVDASDRAALEYFVQRLSVPYVGGEGRSARVKQGALRAMRALARAAPHAARVRFAPAGAVVSRRPG
jgi:hypothetical protein